MRAGWSKTIEDAPCRAPFPASQGSHPRFCFIFLTMPIWPKYSAISASVVAGFSPEIKTVPFTRSLSS